MTLSRLLTEHGFDPVLHERTREMLRAGLIGVLRNQLPAGTVIEDVSPGDVDDATAGLDGECRELGHRALAGGEVAVLTLAGGVGSRWSRGAGAVKALYALHTLGGRDRSFLEVHLAKTQRTARTCGTPLPHIFTTSYLTDEPIHRHLDRHGVFGYEGLVALSRGACVGLRLVPMVRDLLAAWSRQTTAPPDQATRDTRQRLVQWAQRTGCGSDYVDNTPLQCLYPPGHWFEWASLLRNGTLKTVLALHPRLRYVMLHNIDTLGADVDAGLLGGHIRAQADLSFEVVRRQGDDRGGGLARVDGSLRIIEGLALPDRVPESRLSLYNTMTTWITIDRLLAAFGLDRGSLHDDAQVEQAVRTTADRVPTYVTLKQVRNHNAAGQDELFTVAQCEKLWSDMSSLPGLACRYVLVPRCRGQQLKELAQLETWRHDGSADHVEELCAWRP